MEEIAAEIRALRRSLGFMKALLLVQCFFFIGMTYGIYTAASSAGPRLLRLREENDALRKDNVRLRTEAEQKHGAEKSP